jgi:hypothetical protein
MINFMFPFNVVQDLKTYSKSRFQLFSSELDQNKYNKPLATDHE